MADIEGILARAVERLLEIIGTRHENRIEARGVELRGVNPKLSTTLNVLLDIDTLQLLRHKRSRNSGIGPVIELAELVLRKKPIGIGPPP